MKTSKSFHQEYIEKAKKLIHEILEDKKEGWRLIGVLKKMLDDNNIDVANKIREWRK